MDDVSILKRPLPSGVAKAQPVMNKNINELLNMSS